MCQIIKEYVEKEKAKLIVTHIENAAKKVGSVESACELMGVAVSEYIKAKSLAEICHPSE